MTKKMSKADKAMLTAVIVIALFAVGTFYKNDFKKPFAITSGNLDFIKSKCGNPFYNVYQCGSYYCIDSLSGRCVDVDVNCKNAPVVYNCLNLGGTTGCTKSGSNLLINGKIVATDSCSNPTLAVIGTAFKTLYLCKGVSPPSNFVAVSGDLGGYVKYQGSDPSCSTQCLTITEKCPDGSLRLQDSHCNLIPCPIAILCGNGVCDNTETQSSCPQDCIPTLTCYFCKNGLLESGKWQGSCPSGTSPQQLSCETKPVCLQETGQLCKPTTKILGTYTDSCVKQSFINDGYGFDLSPCQSIPPPPPPICTEGQSKQCVINNEVGSQSCVDGQWSECKLEIGTLPTIVWVIFGIVAVGIIGAIWYFGIRKK